MNPDIWQGKRKPLFFRGMWSKGEQIVFVEDQLLDRRLNYDKYPHFEGFNWGAPGNGTQRLAFAILIEYTDSPKLAEDLKTEFMAKFLIHAKPEGFQINAAEIDEFLTAQRVTGGTHVRTPNA